MSQQIIKRQMQAVTALNPEVLNCACFSARHQYWTVLTKISQYQVRLRGLQLVPTFIVGNNIQITCLATQHAMTLIQP